VTKFIAILKSIVSGTKRRQRIETSPARDTAALGASGWLFRFGMEMVNDSVTKRCTSAGEDRKFDTADDIRQLLTNPPEKEPEPVSGPKENKGTEPW
jgi:hypothetical protein